MQADPNNFNDLRRRVKTVIRRLNPYTPTPAEEIAPITPSQLLHKLHAYQNQLEIQNEELRRTQAALKSANARYFDLLEYTSTLYDLAPVGYLTLTTEGAVVEANLTAARLLTATREELLQQPFAHFIVAEEQESFYFFCRQVRAKQRSQRLEVRMRRTDGSLFYVQLDATLTLDILGAASMEEGLENTQYIRITISDISARVHLEEEERKVRAQLEETLVDLRQTQAQMVKQERLAVVGQLAAGIAHDFNNIMAAITLYAQLLMRSTALPENLKARLEVIVVQTERATHLIQQILDFSRRTHMTRQSTPLAHFLQQFIELLEHTLPETISVTLEITALKAGLDDVVSIDSSRIQQVLLNLAVNARDAMPDGGALHITLTRIIADESLPALASGPLTPGPWLRITVRDTGTGIESQDLPRIFEPFFTTKAVGEGSGLGLAQVWGIIKQHEGEIDITSEIGKGTTFSLYLPALSVAPLLPLPAEEETMPSGHGELILVVEDNNVLRTALISALEQLGYGVLEATNGQDAAILMTKEGARVKLILSDLTMPSMSGEGLIRTLRAQGWQQPVVILSGRPLSQNEVEQLYRFGQISWLPKPPSLAQLAMMLDQVLHPDSNGQTL